MPGSCAWPQAKPFYFGAFSQSLLLLFMNSGIIFVVIRLISHTKAHLLVLARAPGLVGVPAGASSFRVGLGALGSPRRPSMHLALVSLLGPRWWSPGAKRLFRVRVCLALLACLWKEFEVLERGVVGVKNWLNFRDMRGQGCGPLWKAPQYPQGCSR